MELESKLTFNKNVAIEHKLQQVERPESSRLDDLLANMQTTQNVVFGPEVGANSNLQSGIFT